MLNKLFKRMAPLVVGVILIGFVSSARADYANITSIYYYTTYHVRCEYTTPPGKHSTYWFLGGSYASSLDGLTDVNTYPGYTNVAIYMFAVDETPSSDYSWASIDDVWGTNIYNGP